MRQADKVAGSVIKYRQIYVVVFGLTAVVNIGQYCGFSAITEPQSVRCGRITFGKIGSGF